MIWGDLMACNINNLGFKTQLVIPQVYDDSMSLLEFMGIVSNTINQMIACLQGIDNNIETILNQYLKDGKLFIDAVYTSETENLSFVFKKVGE